MTVAMVPSSYPEYNSTDSYRMENKDIDIHTFKL